MYIDVKGRNVIGVQCFGVCRSS